MDGKFVDGPLRSPLGDWDADKRRWGPTCFDAEKFWRPHGPSFFPGLATFQLQVRINFVLRPKTSRRYGYGPAIPAVSSCEPQSCSAIEFVMRSASATAAQPSSAVTPVP